MWIVHSRQWHIAWARLEDWKICGTFENEKRKFLQLAGEKQENMGRWGCRGGKCWLLLWLDGYAEEFGQCYC